MLTVVNEGNRGLFQAACAYEHVMGSKCWCSLCCYGTTHVDADFRLQLTAAGEAAAALYSRGGIIVISANNSADPEELAAYVRQSGAAEIDTNEELALRLQAILGGELETSYFMEYRGERLGVGETCLLPEPDQRDVFSVLQQSHAYYRSHLQYDTWAEDIQLRLAGATMELYLVCEEGVPVGTGSIASMDGECGIVAAVAVIPEKRGRKLGTKISAALTNRILDMRKTPRLMSGYDAVAALYRSIGYTECGRWGELYL